jgi:hypothetical protein
LGLKHSMYAPHGAVSNGEAERLTVACSGWAGLPISGVVSSLAEANLYTAEAEPIGQSCYRRRRLRDWPKYGLDFSTELNERFR